VSHTLRECNASDVDGSAHLHFCFVSIHGVASGMADYALILVNSRHPPTHMTHHHLNLCASFGIHIIVIFTKIDGCPEHAIKNSKEELVKLLRAPDIGKKPFAVRNEKDIATCIGKMNHLAPIVETSCVTGEGIDLLQKLLFALPKRRRHENKVKRPFEFLVEDIFNVPGVGSVVSGFVNAGELSVGSNAHVYVGPADDGTFMKCVAKSAHIARINTAHVTSGQSACLALALSKDLRKQLRRGMVVLKESPTSAKEFDAEICVLKGEGTTIRRSYQAYVHILNVRQSAFARKIEIVNNNGAGLPSSHSAIYGEENEIVLRPGCRAKVRFEFAKRPEYIRPGMRMLFRDGRVRGVGLITGIPKAKKVAA
jgi:elongation factor 1-alpha